MKCFLMKVFEVSCRICVDTINLIKNFHICESSLENLHLRRPRKIFNEIFSECEVGAIDFKANL